MKAMILAAGLGTRLKPFTDHHPKALALVNGVSILERNIHYLKKAGVTSIIVNVHHFADQIIECLKANNSFGIEIQVSDEKDEVLETGGGLKKARWFLDGDESFILMNVDILTDMDLGEMINMHEERQPMATLAISERESSRCFLFNDENQLCGWRNKLKGEEKIARKELNYYEFAFSGIHIIHPSIFKAMTQEGKFSMVDVYLELAKQETILGYNHTGCQLLDVGKPESILKAEKIFL